jgi:hypothetical protein
MIKIKIVLIAMLLVVMVSAGLYNKFNNKDYLVYLNDPVGQDSLAINIFGRVISMDKDTMLIRESMYGKEVIVKSISGNWNWEVGMIINLKGIFHKEGYVEYTIGEEIRNTNIKMILSVIGMFFFIFVLYKDWHKLKFDFGTKKENKNA